MNEKTLCYGCLLTIGPSEAQSRRIIWRTLGSDIVEEVYVDLHEDCDLEWQDLRDEYDHEELEEPEPGLLIHWPAGELSDEWKEFWLYRLKQDRHAVDLERGPSPRHVEADHGNE
jgi:hypothetical protein